MNLGLFIGCLAILLAAYWWVLNRLKPRVMQLGSSGRSVCGWERGLSRLWSPASRLRS